MGIFRGAAVTDIVREGYSQCLALQRYAEGSVRRALREGRYVSVGGRG